MLDVVLDIARLVESLQQFPGLFFLRNGREGSANLLGELRTGNLVSSLTLLHLCLLGMKPATSAFL